MDWSQVIQSTRDAIFDLEFVIFMYQKHVEDGFKPSEAYQKKHEADMLALGFLKVQLKIFEAMEAG